MSKKTIKEYKKITTGFVVQTFSKMGDKYVCTEQEFIASDDVQHEDAEGNPVEIDDSKEVYCPFDMKDLGDTLSEDDCGK